MNYVSTSIWKVLIDDPTPTTYTISGATNAYHVALHNFGSPPVSRQIYQYARYDGGVDNGFRLEPRRMIWELFVKADTESDFETKREAVYRMFKPYDNGIKLNVDLAVLGPIRQLDCFVDGPVDFTQSSQMGYSAIVKVPLYAPEPLWYSPTQTTTTSTLGGSALTVTYAGNYEEWPIVEVVGQVQNLVVTTAMTNAYRTETAIIDLTGTTVADGDTYTIDLRPGRKTVRDSANANKVDKLVDDSWVDFKLWPAPFEASGSNSLAYAFTSKNANARLRVKHYNRYLSL